MDDAQLSAFLSARNYIECLRPLRVRSKPGDQHGDHRCDGLEGDKRRNLLAESERSRQGYAKEKDGRSDEGKEASLTRLQHPLSLTLMYRPPQELFRSYPERAVGY
jgi:hypothetical protein